jgi:hypothetical protein
MAALGAMAIAAGMIGVEPVLTSVAVIDMTTHNLRAAVLDVVHRLFMARQHAFAILRPIGRAVFAEDVG